MCKIPICSEFITWKLMLYAVKLGAKMATE